jgi:hypothetical protein
MEYPKIETLYDRDLKTFKVITDHVRCPEFDIVNRWYVTEKIDGTNVRVFWDAANKEVRFGGRTDNAQMPVFLLEHLRSTFTVDRLSFFESDMILYGEGYGAKIQKGGGNYRTGVSFRLFDVLIGKWWLEPYSVEEIAMQLDISTAPALGIISYLPRCISDLNSLVEHSIVAAQENAMTVQAEGIVARSYPLLFTRSGKRVMWKLKFKDF